MYYNTERDALGADGCYVILFGQDFFKQVLHSSFKC